MPAQRKMKSRMIAKSSNIRVSRPDGYGEFDEAFIDAHQVHIERLDTRAWWIGIYAKDGTQINVNTGIHQGTWFFNVEEGKDGGLCASVQRRSCSHRNVGNRIGELLREVDRLRAIVDAMPHPPTEDEAADLGRASE